MSGILKLQRLNKSFGGNHVVKDLTVEVADGEFLTILGPSGCGKTSTLRMIGGFEIPDSGTIELQGLDITKLPANKRNVNTVFQNYALFPNMTVAENIAFGLIQKKTPKETVKRKVSEMLKMIRLEGFDNRMPQALSGGQQQRVAIARAIVNDPQILLLDEPLGALDLKLRKQMQWELKNLHDQLKKTFIYVTHDQDEALTMSDRIAVMNNGVLEQIANGYDIYHQPRTKFVASFIGETNILIGEKCGADVVLFDGVKLPIQKNEIAIGKKVELFIRPEAIVLTKSPTKLSGTIEGVNFLGSYCTLFIRCSSNLITARVSTADAQSYKIGQEVFVDWDINKISIFEN